MPPARLLSISALGALVLLLAPFQAKACTISVGGVAFGNYDPGSASPDDGTALLIVACVSTENSVLTALGAGGSGSYATRRMSNGASNLNYNLYTNSARTIVWGNGSGGSSTVTLTGGILLGGTRYFTRTVYGRIPAGQNVSAGSYGDTIVVTITF